VDKLLHKRVSVFWSAGEASLPTVKRFSSFSLEGEGWDEGVKHLILFSSPQPSPAGEGDSFLNLMAVRRSLTAIKLRIFYLLSI
jgi:hypothetical protein